jgi:hypothetical protein
MESQIRTHLAEAGFKPVAVNKKFSDRKLENCGYATADAAVGLRRGSQKHIERTPGGNPTNYLVASRQGEVNYSGSWDVERDSMRLSRSNKNFSSFIQVLYRGAQAFALLAPPEEGSRYYVRQNNLWLHLGNAGDDVQFDDDGRSFIEARQARLYHLTQNQNDSMQALEIIPVNPGSSVYRFSFTDRCLSLRLPR